MGLRTQTPNVNPLQDVVDPNEFVAPVQPEVQNQPAPMPQLDPNAQQVTQQVTQTENVLRPEDLKAMESAGQETLKVLDTQAKVMTKAAENEKALADAAISKAEADQALMAAETAKYEKVANQRKMEYEQAYKDYTNFKMEPDRFWKDKSTGYKISLVLLSAVSGGFAAVNKNENHVLSIIDAAINRDIDAQRAEYERLKGSVGVAQNQYAQAFQIYQNEIAAKLAVQNAGYEVVKAKLMSMEQSTKSASALAGIQAQKAELNMKQAMTLAELNKVQQTTMFQATDKTKQREIVNKEREMYTPFGQAFSAGEATTIRDSIAGTKNFISVAEQLKDITGKVGTKEYVDAKAAGRLDALQSELVGSIAKIMGSGVLNEGEFNRYKSQLGGALTRPDKTVALVDQMQKEILSKLTNQVNSKVGVPKKLDPAKVAAIIYRDEQTEIAQKYGKASYRVQSDTRNRQYGSK